MKALQPSTSPQRHFSTGVFGWIMSDNTTTSATAEEEKIEQDHCEDFSEEEEEENWNDADFLCFTKKDEPITEIKNESNNQQSLSKNLMAAGITISKNLEAAGISRNKNTDKTKVCVPAKMDEKMKKGIPWMDDCPESYAKSVPPLIRLHNEILSFANLVTARDGEVSTRLDIVERFKNIAYRVFGKDKCEVVVFGSQATGLFLPEADVDIVIHLEKEPEDEDNKAREEREMEEFTPSGSPLDRIADALKEEWKEQLSYLEVLHNVSICYI